MAAFPLMALIGSILGAHLSPDPKWATLPVALMIIGTASGVLPVAKCMSGLGRKRAFLLFMALGIFGCMLAGQALKMENFVVFCASTYLLGVTNAAIQQIRFAAMESVSLDQGPTAVSIIMCAGIVAAFIGPELAVIGRHISAVEYQGSFWLAGACLFTGAVILATFFRAAPARQSGCDKEPRALGKILSNPALFWQLQVGPPLIWLCHLL